uniref:Uncharacterized protein n=1 Tax=Parascaris equorum TaxID=6256 RepID=A0A914RSX6_PAREQ
MYICVWPRGLLTFNIDLSSLSTRKNAANPVKARVTPGVAKALFEVGRLVEVSLGAKDIPLNLQLQEGDGTVSLVTVALVCALWRSRIAQSSKGPFTAEETW